MALTVGKLRKALEMFSDDDLIVLSSDAEGNNHSPLAEVVRRWYMPETTWSGEVCTYPEDLAEHERDDYPEPTEDSVLAAVLYPVN